MTDVKPILLGEAPSKSGDRYHHFPLSGAVGQRLCELAGIEPEADGSRYGRYYWALRERFDCVNVFDRYAEATPWSAPSARDNWAAILGEDYPEQGMIVVVALGRRVAAAVGIEDDRQWGAWSRAGNGSRETRTTVATWMTVIPHPSGLNRLYNSDEVKMMSGVVLREAMEIAGRQPGNEQWCVGCHPDPPDGSSDRVCSGCGPLQLDSWA